MTIIIMSNNTANMDQININMPKEYTGNNVLLKIEKEKPQKIEQKFRSFAIVPNNGVLIIKNRRINVVELYSLLQEHGLSKTLPIFVTLGPTTFTNIDWRPFCYNGPTVWYFKWNDIECSITATNNIFDPIYIRVYDMTLGVNAGELPAGEKILDEIAEELFKRSKDPMPAKSLILYTTQVNIHGAQWLQNCTRLHRNIDTIYIDKSIKDKLINQLTKFYNSSEMYDRYGVTWKRVHLFHGPPGSGKTSTILALASIFNKNIAKLTITPDLNSQHIEALFRTMFPNTWLVLEDVDALFTERTANTSIDFSTLLNCMDGLTTQRGMVAFMTTNHITKLDSAFVRPGRVDMCVEFKLPGREELHEALKMLGQNYIHEHEEFLNNHSKDMSIADLQKHLFECMMDEKKSILM